MTDLLSGWKGYALTALAFLIFGWTVRDWKAGADTAAARITAAEVREAAIRDALDRERAQADVTTAVETKATAAQVQIRTVTRTIIERVPEYVPVQADALCVVPVGAVRLLDAAAAGDPLPEPSGEPDAAAANAQASGVPLSRLVEVTAENYGTYQSVAQQLRDLQEWTRRQQAVTNAP